MHKLIIFQIWRHKLPAFAALATMLAVFFWPSIPLKGIENWLQFFYYYSPQNILYAILTILSGFYVGMYVYNKKVCTTCVVGTEKTGAAGLVSGVLLGACPACIPVLAVFLPLGVSVYLSRISWIFIVIAIIVLLFLIWRMGVLKKAAI